MSDPTEPTQEPANPGATTGAPAGPGALIDLLRRLRAGAHAQVAGLLHDGPAEVLRAAVAPYAPGQSGVAADAGAQALEAAEADTVLTVTGLLLESVGRPLEQAAVVVAADDRSITVDLRVRPDAGQEAEMRSLEQAARLLGGRAGPAPGGAGWQALIALPRS